LTHLEQAPSNIKWSPDGKWIAFTSFVSDTDPILGVKLRNDRAARNGRGPQ
jgi:Tol biopolymer transport system component